ncbi:MAG: Mut7-C RNAse domain-containing protein [Elusimicrobia bacterium]|nr:Mut7-C RNAse domain-containing protein [Elusimicrobiota bacterium]
MIEQSEPKFIVDSMLGRLAVWLRILGYDTEFHSGPGRNELLLRSLKEDRIIITRDTHFTRRQVIRFIFIQSDFLREQVQQLLQQYPNEIKVRKERLFSRCTLCNHIVIHIGKEQVRGRVAPFIYESIKQFSYCALCDKIYWPGTHWEKLLKDLAGMGAHGE